MELKLLGNFADECGYCGHWLVDHPEKGHCVLIRCRCSKFKEEKDEKVAN